MRRVVVALLVASVARAGAEPRIMSDTDGVVVRLDEGPPPVGEAVGRIARAPSEVLGHILAFDKMARAIPHLAEVRVLDRPPGLRTDGTPPAADGEATVYFRFDLPWPIADRDYAARYRWRHEGAGIVVEEEAVAGPPPAPATLRVTHLRCRWELRALDGGRATSARYVHDLDLGGDLTASIRRRQAWRQAMQTFVGVRDSFLPH